MANSPRQPVHTAADQFTRGYNVYSQLIIDSINKNLKKGMPPAMAVRKAWKKTQGTKILTDATLDGIVYSLEASALTMVVKPKAFRKWYLDQYWVPNEKFSRTIWRTGVEMQVKMAKEIRDSMRVADSWTKLALRTDRAFGPAADLPKHITDLIELAKKANRGNPAGLREYKSAINKAQRKINSLALSGAPTTRLKKAYQNIINITRDGHTASIERAVTRAVKAKARYNAERLARTEMARAYGLGFNARLDQDDDIIGWQWRLSSRHKVYDVCDFNAGADMYGAGAGMYPKHASLDYPAHPHCTCNLSPVYSGETGFSNPSLSNGSEWIAKQSVPEQKQLMGVAGQKKFARNPEKWQKEINMWGGIHRRKPSNIPKEFLS